MPNGHGNAQRRRGMAPTTKTSSNADLVQNQDLRARAHGAVAQLEEGLDHVRVRLHVVLTAATRIKTAISLQHYAIPVRLRGQHTATGTTKPQTEACHASGVLPFDKLLWAARTARDWLDAPLTGVVCACRRPTARSRKPVAPRPPLQLPKDNKKNQDQRNVSKSFKRRTSQPRHTTTRRMSLATSCATQARQCRTLPRKATVREQRTDLQRRRPQC